MTPDFSRKIPEFHAKLYEGKRGLIVGIANEHSIAWGCAAAFRGLGADLAVTYLNDKARRKAPVPQCPRVEVR
jgi:enoyl-[acyl-carrier protein] reductase I